MNRLNNRTIIYKMIISLGVVFTGCKDDLNEIQDTKLDTRFKYGLVSNKLDEQKSLSLITFDNASAEILKDSDKKLPLIKILTRLSSDELNCILLHFNIIESQIRHEKTKDDSIDVFIQIYGVENFVFLRDCFFEYISEGGHDIYLLDKLLLNYPEVIRDYVICTCAYADNLTSETFWLDDSLSSKHKLIPSDEMDPGREYECRKNYRDKLALLCISQGLDLGL